MRELEYGTDTVVLGLVGSTSTFIRASNLFVRVVTEINAYVTGMFASAARRMAVTCVRRPPTLCDVTRAGAGGRLSAVDADSGVVVRNESHSVVVGRNVASVTADEPDPCPTLLIADTENEY